MAPKKDSNKNKRQPVVGYGTPEDAQAGVNRAGLALGQAYEYACKRLDIISDTLDDLDPETDSAFMNILIRDAQAIEGEWIIDPDLRVEIL